MKLRQVLTDIPKIGCRDVLLDRGLDKGQPLLGMTLREESNVNPNIERNWFQSLPASSILAEVEASKIERYMDEDVAEVRISYRRSDEPLTMVILASDGKEQRHEDGR